MSKIHTIFAGIFETLVRGCVARRMEDLDDDTLKTIAAAEVPAQYSYLDDLDVFCACHAAGTKCASAGGLETLSPDDPRR